MRKLLLALSVAALAQSAPSLAQEYRVVAQLPAGDGGWDLLSVDPADQRLYVAHGDGVTAIDLRSRHSDRPDRAGAAGPCRARDPRHARRALDQRRDQQCDAVRRPHRQGPGDDRDRHEAGRRGLRSCDADGVGHEPRQRRRHGDRSREREGARDRAGRRLARARRRRRARAGCTSMSRTGTKSPCSTRGARKLVSRFALEGCDGPTGIAYDPQSREILSACGGNGVAIVSAPDGRQIARTADRQGRRRRGVRREAGPGAGPRRPRRQSHGDPARRQAGGGWPGCDRGQRADDRARSVDGPRLSAVGDARSGAVGNERPKPVPGTFRVLVVAP